MRQRRRRAAFSLVCKLAAMSVDRDLFEQTRRNAVNHLLAQRNEQGHWTGYLSSSALSTATAITALSLIDRGNGDQRHRDFIRRGAAWLVKSQNEDGGWGDTDKSFSNISTTALCWAALGLPETQTEGTAEAAERARRWLNTAAGGESIDALVEAIMRRYGDDRTFSVPILTMSALCGRLGPPEGRDAWRHVMQLPFELAALPQKWFRLMNLQVVSYALPALIAIGQVRHHHRPTRNPLTRLLRNSAIAPTLRLLERIQPSTGGFLEATPLTSFVSMSLAACGFASHPVTQRAAAFLRDSIRGDGSWPIDTNLATWVTTLSINALASGSRLTEYLAPEERTKLRDWLLNQQHNEKHPYTGAAPGGWAWTDLPGGVPDADDTSGAILALHHLDPADEDRPVSRATQQGNEWLMHLQNRDGGVPTFCRGWGRLPFDRSSVDISAHALRAFGAEKIGQVPIEQVRFEWLAVRFFERSQRADGSLAPLWFGNQHRQDEENPTYGTSRVLLGLTDRGDMEKAYPQARQIIVRARDWLLKNQSDDGGWGGGVGTPSSIEETALAVEALAAVAHVQPGENAEQARRLNESIERGVAWLIEHTRRGTQFDPSPIGFYFAKLWYYEMLYPVIFTVEALERVAKLWAADGAGGRGSGRAGSEDMARAEPRPPENESPLPLLPQREQIRQ